MNVGLRVYYLYFEFTGMGHATLKYEQIMYQVYVGTCTLEGEVILPLSSQFENVTQVEISVLKGIVHQF